MGHRSSAQVNLEEARSLSEHLKKNEGYVDCRVLEDGTVACLYDLLYTRAVVLGCTRDSWTNRFCFEDRSLATRRFNELKSEDDVPEGHIASRSVRRPGGT
jgi:hypothetical protein